MLGLVSMLTDISSEMVSGLLPVFLVTQLAVSASTIGLIEGAAGAVTMLVNRSGESGLEAKVTNALLDEITRRRQDLVVSVEQADAILSGTIDNLSTQTAARSGTLTATERKVVITVSLTLKDRNGEVLWQGARLVAEQAFPVADTKPQTESNRRAAMNEVAKRLAEYAYERLTDNF